jgi:hypothetical protein
MGENSAAEVILTTVGSNELGLDAGTWADLDAVVSKLDRESLALRIVSVLTGLNADAAHGGRSVSLSLASALGEAHPLASALLKSNAVFVEPLQQLVLLRRCLTLAHAGEDISSDIGLGLYVDASRYTSDATP